MNKFKRIKLAVLCAGLSLASNTVINAEEAKGPWEGSAGLGFFSSSGNSESTNLNATLGVAYNNGSRWTHKLDALAFNSDSNEVRSGERYFAAYQADLAINQRSYLFGRIEGDKDRFSAYDLRTTEALGYGYKIFDTDTHKWSTEIGLGASQLDPIDGSEDISEMIGLIGTDYLWAFSPTAEFEQNIDYQIGSDNKFLNSVTSIRAKVWEKFGVRLSYNIKNNSDVPVNVEKTDKYTSIGIDYSF